MFLLLACREPEECGKACEDPTESVPTDSVPTDSETTDSSTPDTDPPPPYDCSEDFAVLTVGVTTIEQGGSLPSQLIVHGDMACPIVLDEAHRTFVAAASWGAGHVFHAGHEGMIVAPHEQGGDNLTLFLNALRWAGGGDAPRVGYDAGLDYAWLGELGFEVVRVGVEELDSVEVFLADAYTERTDSEYAAIRDHVATGGGFIQGGHAWYWAYENANVAEDFMGNQILNPMGITVTAATVEAGSDTVGSETPSNLYHAAWALDAIEAHLDGSEPLGIGDQRKAAATVGDAVTHLPFSFTDYFDRVRALLDTVEPVVPGVSAPISTRDQPIEALLVLIQTRFAAELPVDEVIAVPSAFPGEVPADSVRTTITVDIDAGYAGRDEEYAYSNAGEPVWRGTGAYIPPGEIVTLTVPENLVGQGLTALIGTHTDDLGALDEWMRHPRITRSWPIDAATTEIASGFGGPLYVRVPAGSALGSASITITGAVAYPRFVRGETDPTVFLAAVAAGVAPITEFESDKFVLTVPTANLPARLEPEVLTAFWDSILDADATLAAISTDRVRAERFAMDVQISAGWMHSGYPIMGYQYTETLADAAFLVQSGDWGAFHELGHNHQYGPTNLPGTTECTVNLWSVYDFEEVLGIDRSAGHSALTAGSREDTITAYLDGGLDFDADWNVWTCLETYLQLEEAFGWPLFQELNATYLTMTDRPRTDQQKVDRWVVESSLATGLDLTPFYDAWGFPISESTRTTLADLPPWEDHPMAE